jgi:hypothetical protein
LTLKPGEIIKILSTEGEEWFEGELNGKTGFFPVLYVEILSDSSLTSRSRSASTTNSPSLSPSSSMKPFAVGKVLFDYNAKSIIFYYFSPFLGDVELSVKPGDIVKIISLTDEEWAEAEFNGKFGFIPKLYLEVIQNQHLGPPPPPPPSEGKQEIVTDMTSPVVISKTAPAVEISKDFHRNFAVRATKTYEPKQLGEIDFEVGDILCVLDASSPEWYGIFKEFSQL